MRIQFEKWLFVIGLIIIFAFSVSAQKSTPQPTPPDDAIKILTEEVHLNVTAQTDDGRIVQDLKIDDLLLVEEGMPQTITSVKQIPANVLLLLDTGGNLNFAKNRAMTAITAKVVAKYLSPKGEARKVRIGSHLDGVQVRSRQKLTVSAANPLNKK